MIKDKTAIFSEHLVENTSAVKNLFSENPSFYSATIIQTQHFRLETFFIQFTYIRIYIRIYYT